MKKIFYLLSISLLLLQGCSSDSGSNNNTSSAILCKTIKFNESDATNIRNYRTEFTYVGNKFNERKDYYNDVLTSKSVYIYTGNLITQVKGYDENNIYNSLSTITYNNSGLPISILNIDNETGSWVGYKSNFVYNQNGTITELSYSGDVNTQNTLDETTTYTLQNNILVSQITIGGTYTTSYSFTYDTKNSPFKNVIGLNNFFGPLSQEHNLLQTIQSDGVNSPIIEDFQYIYNSDGYPTSRLPPCSSCSITEYIY
jgi:hypothetical protein